MKTFLPTAITTVQEAETFLMVLYTNGEAFHPEDDAHGIVWDLDVFPTSEEADQLNKLMGDIYSLPGNEMPMALTFDPCEFLNRLSGHTGETE